MKKRQMEQELHDLKEELRAYIIDSSEQIKKILEVQKGCISLMKKSMEKGDEYQKEGHTVLELRFPDTDAGWASWRNLVENVRKFEKNFSARIEEIGPGQLKATIHLA